MRGRRSDGFDVRSGIGWADDVCTTVQDKRPQSALLLLSWDAKHLDEESSGTVRAAIVATKTELVSVAVDVGSVETCRENLVTSGKMS